MRNYNLTRFRRQLAVPRAWIGRKPWTASHLRIPALPPQVYAARHGRSSPRYYKVIRMIAGVLAGTIVLMGSNDTKADDAPEVLNYRASLSAFNEPLAGRFRLSSEIQGAKAIRLLAVDAALETGPLFVATPASDTQIVLEYDWPRRGRKRVATLILDGDSVQWEWDQAEVVKPDAALPRFEKSLHVILLEVCDEREVIARFQFFKPQELKLSPFQKRKKHKLSRSFEGMRLSDDGTQSEWDPSHEGDQKLAYRKNSLIFVVEYEEATGEVWSSWDKRLEEELTELQAKIKELQREINHEENKRDAKGKRAPTFLEREAITKRISKLNAQGRKAIQRCREINKVVDQRIGSDYRRCRSRVELANGVVVARILFEKQSQRQ